MRGRTGLVAATAAAVVVSGLTGSGVSPVSASRSDGENASQLAERRAQFIAFMRALAVPMSDQTLSQLFDSTVGELVDAAEEAGLNVPDGLYELDPDALSRDVLTPLAVLPLAEQLVEPVEVGAETIAYLSDRYGLDPEEAAEWGRRFIHLSNVATALQMEYPDHWAGAGLEHQDRVLRVAVSSETDADDMRARLTDSDIVVEVVDYSMSELIGGMKAIAEQYGLQPSTYDFEDLTPYQRYISLSENFETNSIDAWIDASLEDADEVAADLPQLTPIRVNVFVGDFQASNECTPQNCVPPFRGGLIAYPPGCTYGFVFTNGSAKWASTAGHCGSTYYTHNGHGVGTTQWVSVASQNIDAQLISIDNPSFWTPQPWYYRDSDAARVVGGIMSQASASYNTIVCHSGVGSYAIWSQYTSCGALDSKYASLAGNSANLGRFTACLHNGGDSGGPTFGDSVSLAYGLHKGGDYYQGSGRCYFSWTSDVTDITGWSPLVSGGK